MRNLKVLFVNFLIVTVCAFCIIFAGKTVSETSMNVEAYTSGYYTYTVSYYNEAMITDVDTSISGDIVVPSTLGGYSVTSIGDYAFVGCSGLTSVTIGNGVTSIGDYAFVGCNGLTSIEIPESITHIGYYALPHGEYLEEINVSPSNTAYTSIDGVLYSKCITMLRCYPPAKKGCFVIPDGVIYIASDAFRNCSGLTGIEIPDSIISIGSYAFSGCDGLTSIEIPDSVTFIDSCAFENCSSLTHIEIPDSVTHIIEGAFDGCSNLEKMTIPYPGIAICYYYTADSYEPCYPQFFSDLFGDDGVPTSLKEIVITGDGDMWSPMFSYCNNITSVNILGDVTNICDGAFRGCSSLESINILPSNAEYTDIDGVLYSKDRTTLICCPAGKKGDFIIPEGVTSIYDYAFEDCSGLTSVTIPSSVTSIGNNVFKGCNSLTKINVSYSNTVYADIDGVLYSKDKTTLLCCPGDKDGDFVIPSYVACVGDYAFGDCGRFTSVEIPNSVTSIGQFAFKNCRGLTEVEIPKSVTTIGTSAFEGCNGLEKMTIPFVGAELNGTTNTHFGYIFGASYVGDNSRYVPATLKEVVITCGTDIGELAFYGCSSLTSIVIPRSVTLMGDDVFNGCSSLTSIVVPNSVSSISAGAFYRCSSLRSIVIPRSVTLIEEYAFYGCSSLTSIVIPRSVTLIGDFAFDNPDITIYGAKDSYAETYALENGYKFAELNIPAEGLALVGGVEHIYMDAGDTYNAVFDVYPEDTTDEITLTANNANVTIEGHNIYANNAGETVITATTTSGVTYEFTVHIRDINSITIVELPVKREYELKTSLDTTGLIVKANYTDGSAVVITDYKVSGYNALKNGVQTITVTYGKYTATFIVWVGITLTDISVNSESVGKVYNIGDKFNYDTLAVTLNFSDGTTYAADSNYTVTGFNSDTVGEKIITVEYLGVKTEFTVDIVIPDVESGDVDNDGSIDISDASLAYTVLLNKSDANALHKITADVDGNGSVNILDIMSLLNKI